MIGTNTDRRMSASHRARQRRLQAKKAPKREKRSTEAPNQGPRTTPNRSGTVRVTFEATVRGLVRVMVRAPVRVMVRSNKTERPELPIPIPILLKRMTKIQDYQVRGRNIRHQATRSSPDGGPREIARKPWPSVYGSDVSSSSSGRIAPTSSGLIPTNGVSYGTSATPSQRQPGGTARR